MPKFLSDGIFDGSSTDLIVDGKIGIGTASPADFLHIGSVGGGSIRIETYETNAYAQMASADGNLSLRSDPSNAYSSSIIDFTIDNNEKMRITSAGNVGIGTTSPAVKLHVGSTSTSGTTTEEFRLQSGTSSGNGGTAIANLVTGNFGISGIYFGNNTTYSSQPAYLQYQRSSNVTTLKFDVNFNIDQGASGTRFNINSSGNVGIGTTSPDAKLTVFRSDSTYAVNLSDTESRAGLSVKSSGSFDSKLTISSGASSTQYIQAVNNAATTGRDIVINPYGGNVGIGIASPAHKLHVVGTNNDPIIRAVRGNNTAQYLDIRGYQILSQGNHLLLTAEDAKEIRLGQESNLQRMTIASSGNVGIGTTSPAAKLEVEGGDHLLQVSTTAGGGNPYISFNQAGTRRSFIQHADNGDFLKLASEYGGISFFTGTGGTETQKVTILSGGNVGIGAATPVQKVHIDGGSSTAYLHFSNTDTGPTTNDGADIGITNEEDLIVWNREATNLRFATSGAERMRITSAGKVGIGTTSPNQKLTIKGTDQYVATEHTSYPWGGTQTIGLKTGTDATAGLLDFRRWVGSAAIHGTALITQKNSDGGYGLDFRVDTQSSNTVATTSRMFLSQSGEVGIGTISPSAKLHINQDNAAPGLKVDGGSGGVALATFARDVGATGSSISINAQSNFPQIQFANTGNTFSIGGDTSGNFKISDANAIGTNDRITIDNTGNVGIGTTSPSQKLSVAPDTDVSAEIGKAHIGQVGFNDYAGFSHVDQNTQQGYALIQQADGSTYMNANTGKNIRFRIANSDKMILNSSGNVGIGTTSPAAKLDISDTADEVDLTSSTNFAINTGGLINAKHYKHVNLEAPEMEWSIGGSTDLNWKKLATIVINDASYSGFGAEIEITDFSGNYGSATAEYGDVYRGGLSIYHRAGSGVTPEEGIITIHNDMIPYIRIYKIAGSGNSSYQIQVKSPGNYRQINIKLKGGIGNQVADIFSHANDTNGSTSGGTAYTPDAYTSGNQFKTGFTTVTANRGNILYRMGVANTAPSYPLDVTGDIRATGAVIENSDIRVKENIKTIDNAVNKVKALRGVEYNKIDSTEKSIGVIAQEIEEVIPQVVREGDQGMKSVAYGNITAVLINAIKEQQNQIENLESRIQTLENQ